MNLRSAHIMTGLCGILGAVVLVTSFVINPTPPANLTTAQLGEFARQHHFPIVLGGWLQGMGSLLLVLFALALVHLAGAVNRFAGWITLLAGTCILLVSLVEIALYLAIAQATLTGDTTVALVSDALRKAVQHIFLIAPALLLPLGVVLLGSSLLPRGFAYTALLLGAILQVFGLVGLFDTLQPVIDNLLIVQAVWFIAASVVLLVGAGGRIRITSSV